ncbi:MAG TPA: preprotein translocase subunit SecE [Candidatus Dojkabacteria bacterium]|nr:preprotein translocase subunit SecE [Candidatus Dojkabacteria bacterium]
MKILKNILTELKKSKWPKGKELLVLSIYALVLCGIITAIILGLDLVFYKAREWFLNL